MMIADPHLTFTCKICVDRFILSPSGVEKPQFLHFLDFGIYWCWQLVAIWESWTRMHYCKPSPIQRHQNRFCTPTPLWRNRAHKLWHSKAWQTDKKLSVFRRPGGWSNPSNFILNAHETKIIFSLLAHYRSKIFSTVHTFYALFDDTESVGTNWKITLNSFDENQFLLLSVGWAWASAQQLVLRLVATP